MQKENIEKTGSQRVEYSKKGRDKEDLILLNMAGVLPRDLNKLSLLKNARQKFDLKKELDLIDKNKVKIVTIYDEGYPVMLKKIDDPPYILYIKGNILPEDNISIAIVGSRRCTHYGLMTAERLARELAGIGFTVVSGAARGIDSASHRGALSISGRTIAVLGSGLANIYPPENKKLLEQISQNGAVISEFPMKMPPYKANFPRRNRIISGFSLGVVVVEAANKSGALITADYALEQNREVFAVPGNAKSISSGGTNRLIREGAKLVETKDDILEELNPKVREYIDTNLNRPPANGKKILNDEETVIYKLLDQDKPVYIDEVIDKSSLSNSVALKVLLGLQIKGLIQQLPGNQFVKRGV